MKGGPTKRQNDLLSLIYEFIRSTGYPPSFEEMREKLGVSSNQSVIDLLEKLKNIRMIQRNASAARGIVILPSGYEALGKPPLGAFLGATAAGAATEAVEITGQWETLHGDVAKFKDDVFLLKINGDSMINAGINDGDVVLVKAQKEFISGDIVLARVGDSTTVKRFISEDKPPYTYLKPENPKYNYILFTDDTELTGKVISVIRSGNWRTVA